MPEIISVDNKVYYLQYSDSFTGDVFMITDNEPFYSLASALNKIFTHSELNYQHCLLTVSCNTVAISTISGRKFKILDSHWRCSREHLHVPESLPKGQVERKQLVLFATQNNRCTAKFVAKLRGEGVKKNIGNHEFLQDAKQNKCNTWKTINLYVGGRARWRTIRYILWYIYMLCSKQHFRVPGVKRP